MDEQQRQALIASLEASRQQLSREAERVIAAFGHMVGEAMAGFESAIEKLKQQQ